MACRYSLKQMTALRMLVFGSISVVLSIFVSTGVWLLISREVSILGMMSISFSALFLFAAIQLLIEWKWKAPVAYFFTPIIWAVMSILLLAAGEPAEHFLLKILLLFSGWLQARCRLLWRDIKTILLWVQEGALVHAVG
jgi:hypothetical protein